MFQNQRTCDSGDEAPEGRRDRWKDRMFQNHNIHESGDGMWSKGKVYGHYSTREFGDGVIHVASRVKAY